MKKFLLVFVLLMYTMMPMRSMTNMRPPIEKSKTTEMLIRSKKHLDRINFENYYVTVYLNMDGQSITFVANSRYTKNNRVYLIGYCDDNAQVKSISIDKSGTDVNIITGKNIITFKKSTVDRSTFDAICELPEIEDLSELK